MYSATGVNSLPNLTKMVASGNDFHNFQTIGTICRNLYRKIEANEKSKDNSEFSNHVSRNLGQQRLYVLIILELQTEKLQEGMS